MEFENRYYITDEMLKEYVSRVLCKKTVFAGFAISFVSLLLCIGFYGKGNMMGAGLYGGLFLVTLLTSLLIIPLTCLQLKHAGERLHNGKTCETVVTFSDKIRMTEGAVSMEFEYGQVIAMHILKYSIVLMIGKKQAVILKTEGFALGSAEEFLPFIREKCRIS